MDRRDYKDDFVSEWTRRAVCEEFGLSNEMYSDMFDQKTLKVLSLDFEMDIYNFALVCTVRMRHNCEHFRQAICGTVEQKEISDIEALEVSSIPDILLGYPGNQNQYHPSSYLRLLLFYLYKNGYRRTCKAFQSKSRK